MEFGENGVVISDTSESMTPEKGYSDGPRPAMGLYRAMRLSLFAFILAQLAYLATTFVLQVGPLSRWGETVLLIVNPDILVAATALFYLLVLFIAFFCSGRFIYRSMRNLHSIGSPEVKISPGWSVGFYFIPIMNLFKPAIAMSEIYHGSHQAVGEASRHKSPIPYSWTCWLFMDAPEFVADRAGLTGVDAFALYALTTTLGIAAAVFLIRMGHRIAVRQERLQRSGAALIVD